MTLKLIEAMPTNGEGGAYIAAEEAEAMVATIALSKTSRKRAKVLAHELANHLMRTKVAPVLYGADEVICTDQNNRAVRHEIARRVEELAED
jgi:hypothetical protein